MFLLLMNKGNFYGLNLYVLLFLRSTWRQLSTFHFQLKAGRIRIFAPDFFKIRCLGLLCNIRPNYCFTLRSRSLRPNGLTFTLLRVTSAFHSHSLVSAYAKFGNKKSRFVVGKKRSWGRFNSYFSIRINMYILHINSFFVISLENTKN